MPYKDILVVLDDTPACRERVDIALRLAAVHDAHVIGLFVVEFGYIPSYAEAQIPAEVFAQRQDMAHLARERVQQAFDQQAQAAGVVAEWRTAEDDAVATVSLHSRYTDLTVIGQYNPESRGAFGSCPDLAEHVVLDCGRPVLTVPYVGKYPVVGKRIMVAWNASREAARAVADAMPLLQAADSVATLAVNPTSGQSAGTHGEVPGADIALHLARHGVKVQAQRIETKDVTAANMLLSRMADESIDLLVMGAYGHARLRELVLGGVTRDVMRQMTVPVLMSH